MNCLAYLDTESTGKDPATARIVEICIIRDGSVWTQRFNPGVPIPAEATEKHGITDDDVRDCPRFEQLAGYIQESIVDRVLCGHNVRLYDSILIDAELRRAGQPGLRDGSGRIFIREVDTLELLKQLEGRTLSAALERITGVKLGDDAHGAEADTRAVVLLLEGICRLYGLEDATVDALCALSVPVGEVDRGGSFRLDENGIIRFAFGKHRGEPVHSQPSYLSWICRSDFSEETKGHAQRFLDEIEAREEARRQGLLAEDGLQLVGVQPELF